METSVYDGMAEISKGNRVPFHYENGEIEFYLGGSICTIEEGTISVVGQCYTTTTGGMIYFHFPTPLENYGVMKITDESGSLQVSAVSMGSIRHNVDFYIENYEEQSEFTQMRFAFSELDYFIPSSNACGLCGTDDNFTDLMFSRTPKEIMEFSFNYLERQINLSLRIYAEGKCGIRSTASTKTELLLKFEKIDDIDFFVSLFGLINDVFCFLCNRRNITLHSATLVGNFLQKFPSHKNRKAIIDERPITTFQTLVVINKYKDKCESEKVIQKTIRYTTLSAEFKQLFTLFVNNKVSVLSVHSSVTARNLIDLKQSLHITAAFEHYYREYIPDTPSKDSIEFCDEILALLQEYIENHSGKKKKKAKNLMRGISPEPSLKDKILKVYRGCQGWTGLDSILGEWVGSQIDDLAEIANEWRNELAHEKGEYEPDRRVVSAIRLVEHLNYCIVLRQAGYCDEQIKIILEEILVK
ncbi:hypothetical protein A7X67_00145 [Clostridium sp. W14A]|nr:hypothetical protein A7X67_00145 [Clostridium sp. W14A]